MEKITAYRIATFGLLLMNLGLLAFLFLAPRPRASAKNPAHETLQLDAAQDNAFRQLATAHKQEMRVINAKQNKLLLAYFAQLKTETAANKAPLPTAVVDLESKKITSVYRHFLDVKQLLRPEQLPAYGNFVDRMSQRILYPTRPDKRPRRGGKPEEQSPRQ